MDQTPVSEVPLEGFRIDRFEVRVREYAQFLSYAGGEAHYDTRQPIERVVGGYASASGHGNEPIRFVHHKDAQAYCAWAGGQLPSEAQWQAAAAGTDNRRFPWGDSGLNCTVANYFTGSARCHNTVLDVDAQPLGATPEGIQGLTGNVSEWTDTVYAPYNGASDEWAEDLMVARGGSFLDSPLMVRNPARHGLRPTQRSATVGFRCVDDGAALGNLPRGELPPLPLGHTLAEPTPTEDLGPNEAESVTVVAAELGQAIALAKLDDGWAVADKRGNRLIELRSGQAATFDVDAPVALAVHQGELWVCGATGIHRLEPTGLQAQRRGNCTALAGSETVLAALVDGALITRELDEAWTVQRDASAGISLAVQGRQIFLSSKEGGERGAAFVDRLDLSTQATTSWIPANQLGEWMYIPHLGVHADQLTYASTFRRWPHYGFPTAHDLTTTRADQRGYSPPRPREVVPHNGALIFSHRAGIDRVDGQGETQPLVAWTQACGLYIDDNTLVWLDSHRGLLLSKPLN
jgi:hypothetical protein